MRIKLREGLIFVGSSQRGDLAIAVRWLGLSLWTTTRTALVSLSLERTVLAARNVESKRTGDRLNQRQTDHLFGDRIRDHWNRSRSGLTNR